MRKYGATEVNYKVRFLPEWVGKTLLGLQTDIEAMFQDLIDTLRERHHLQDRVRVYIHSSDFKYNKPIVIPLRFLADLDVESIMRAVINVLNSNENVVLDENFRVDIGLLKSHRGGGRLKMVRNGLHDPFNEKFHKRCIINIPDDDKMCAARAICVAEAVLTKDKRLPNLRAGKRTIQKNAAIALLHDVGLPCDREIELSEFHKFEDKLDIQIIVYNKPLADGIIYIGKPRGEMHEIHQKIFLYYSTDRSQGHFDVICSMAAFLSKSYYCRACLVAYTKQSEHTCATKCTTCHSDACSILQPLTCRSCQQECRSLACYARHLAPRQHGGNKKILKSSCKSYWRCPTCSLVADAAEKADHECGHINYCRKCSKKILKGEKHLCFMRASQPKQTSGKFIFFDFETRVDNDFQCDTGYRMLAEQNCPNCTPDLTCDACKVCINCKNPTCALAKHIANYAIAQSVCNSCVDFPLEKDSQCIHCGTRCYQCSKIDTETKEYMHTPCPDTCGFREAVFKGEDIADEFADWLCSPVHKDFTCLAHNSKSFDSYFILNYILNKTFSQVSCIYSGGKILCMRIPEYRISFLDSISFMPMALSKIPKCFGLKAAKGTFPHLFNRLENWHYVGALPDIAYYDIDSMSDSSRRTFLDWYHSKKDDEVFHFQKEMYEYCREDVNILRLACMAFRKMLLQLTCSSTEKDSGGCTIYNGGVDAFSCVTLASMCIEIFRSKFLHEEWGPITEEVETPDSATPPISPVPANTNNTTAPPQAEELPRYFIRSDIGLIPDGGYTCKDTFSKKSLIWLAYLEKKEAITIQHALKNGGEFKIPSTNFRADGWCHERNSIYSYYGCYYHGCPKHTARVKGLILGRPPTQLYAMTVNRAIKIKSLGFRHIEIWECEFDEKLKKIAEEERKYLEALEFIERLYIRECLFGGRTNGIRLHCKVRGNQKIRYVDFTSLYPDIMKNSRYPLFHPEIITSNFKDISQYFGIAKVKVAPPRGLYHPVLPFRSANGRLKFPLCRNCAERELLTPCVCSDAERAFIGTYVTVELQEAIKQGYVIEKMYEVYHFPESSQYSPESKMGGLFAAYINTFLKVKTESSGYPHDCQTEEAKTQYIARYLEKEGIELNPDNIEFNPGLRLVGKAALNSLWGRLAKRNNLPKTLFARSPEAFFSIINDAQYTTKDFHLIGEHTVALEYETKQELVKEDSNTNVILAAFTTAYARLKLYECLKKLGDAVLYFDTDSIVYLYDPAEPEKDLPLGEFLGDLTDEVPPGQFITEFVVTAPKSYAYILSDGSEVCKVRGFTLNHRNSLSINFNIMKEIVLNHPIQNNPDPVKIPVVNARKINRDKKRNIIFNRKEVKLFKAVYTKRVVQANLSTLPYGF